MKNLEIVISKLIILFYFLKFFTAEHFKIELNIKDVKSESCDVHELILCWRLTFSKYSENPGLLIFRHFDEEI